MYKNSYEIIKNLTSMNQSHHDILLLIHNRIWTNLLHEAVFM